jgi:hypothetical protein
MSGTGLSDPYNVSGTIASVASAEGVPPALAVADAEVESGLDPYAVGDKGTSFGLFQLHEGGELPSDWSQWEQGPEGPIPTNAADPSQNAQVALSHMAEVYASEPGADPGQIAADAQRPQDKAGYAAQVDKDLATTSGIYGDDGLSAAGSSSSSGSSGSAGSSGSGTGLSSGSSGVEGDVLSFLGLGSTGTDIAKVGLWLVLAAGAVGLLVLGVKQATSSSQTVQEAKGAATSVAGTAAEVAAV